MIDVCSGIVMKWKEYEAEKIHKGKEEGEIKMCVKIKHPNINI